MSRLCGLMYYWLWPNTLQSGRWKVKPILDLTCLLDLVLDLVSEMDEAKEKPKRKKHA